MFAYPAFQVGLFFAAITASTLFQSRRPHFVHSSIVMLEQV